MTASCYCVPYYAGARAVIYRKDYYSAAGIKGHAEDVGSVRRGREEADEEVRLGQKLLGLLLPGQELVRVDGVRLRLRRSDRSSQGRKVERNAQLSAGDSRLDEAEERRARAIAGSTHRGRSSSVSQHSSSQREASASFVGNGWEWPYTLDPKVGNPDLAPVMAAYPMPSHIKGRYMPTFLGGSDLAVPITSSKKSLAVDWIAAFTNSANMRAVAKAGNIPNATSLVGLTKGNPKVEPFAKAAKYSWFIPKSPNWANVENANVLQDMCSQILSGSESVKAATNIGKQRDHEDPQRRLASRPNAKRSEQGDRRRERSFSRLSAAAPLVPASRHRGRVAPYALLAPAAVVLGAVLFYPLYLIARLSFEKYGLFELIRHQGKWIGLDNYTQIIHDGQFWRVLAADDRVHSRERVADDGPRDRDCPIARESERRRALHADGSPRLRLGDTSRRRGRRVALDCGSRVRHPELGAHQTPRGRFLPP